MFKHFGHRTDPVPIGMRAEAVVEAGALQPVAVGHFDRIDFGQIERAGNRLHVIEPVLVADRVHPVTQGNVLDIELLRGRIRQSYLGRHAAILFAIFSAVRSAAEVMMSRLPA